MKDGKITSSNHFKKSTPGGGKSKKPDRLMELENDIQELKRMLDKIRWK